MFKKSKEKITKTLEKGLSYLFNILPVQNNKIFFYSYYGSQYGCNPKYITEYILNHYPEDHYDLVWSLNHIDNEVLPNSGIRKVKNMSLRSFYERCTSKVVITNFRTTDSFVKRKNQHYIQTWHSSLRLKQIEQDAEHSLPSHYVKMAKKDSTKCDLLLSGSLHSSDIIRRAFWYPGMILEKGTPRNDIFFQDNSIRKDQIRNKLGISPEKKVVLYAPTFRKNNSMDYYNLNYQKVIQALQEKHQDEWMMLIKLHPHLSGKSDLLPVSSQVMDVTSYDDTQELLLIADVLITDYSSLMFDYSHTRRPCYLYTPDRKEYVKNDRNLYFDLDELPFIHAETTEELLEKVNQFNEACYHKELENFLRSIGSFEKGKACEALLEHLEKICFGKKRRKFDEAV